jgi:Uma2 family endonuclease
LAGGGASACPEVPLTAYLDLAPDWLCEVLSPSTRALDRGPKLRVYAEQAGRRSYRIAQTFEGDAAVRARPFDAIELQLSALWMR